MTSLISILELIIRVTSYHYIIKLYSLELDYYTVGYSFFITKKVISLFFV